MRVEPKLPTELKRELGSRQMMMIGVGGAIGTGLFLGSSLAISHAGPSVILAYAACSLVALVIAWALAEMVVVHPDAGGFGAIARRYLGPGTGFVIRWMYWAVNMIMIGGELIAAGLYVQYWWPSVSLWIPVAVFSCAIIAVNVAAVRFFGESEYWFSMIKVTAIVVFIILGSWMIIFGLPDAPASGLHNLTAHDGFLPNGIHGLMIGVVFALFSYLGTEISSVTAAESAYPERDVPRATRAMIMRMALFYVVSIAIIVIVIPWTVSAQGGSIEASPFVRVFEAAGVPAAAVLMNGVVLTAALSSANAALYLGSRMMHSLAEDRLSPTWAGRLSSRGCHGTRWSSRPC